jgi:hypothetical protein
VFQLALQNSNHIHSNQSSNIRNPPRLRNLLHPLPHPSSTIVVDRINLFSTSYRRHLSHHMHRYRPYSSASSSRATPTTRCQKCLKLGRSSCACCITLLYHHAALLSAIFVWVLMCDQRISTVYTWLISFLVNRSLQLRMQGDNPRPPLHLKAVTDSTTSES